MRAVSTALLLCVLSLVAALGSARAQDAIVITPDADRVVLNDVLQFHDGLGDRLTLGAGEDQPLIDVSATTGNDDPRWIVFAVTNDGPDTLMRWLVVENTGSAGSGLLPPVLAGPRLISVTAAGAADPVQVSAGRSDIYELVLPPGEVATFIVETAGPQPRDLVLWLPTAYRDSTQAFAFYNGLLVGIVGLLAIFLSSLYVVRRRLMYPAAAGAAWAALILLSVEFGLWEAALGAGSGVVSGVRVASEALMGAAFAFLLSTFLEVRARWPRLGMVLYGSIGLALLTGIVGFIAPAYAAVVARTVFTLVVAGGVVLIVLLALSRSTRAVSLAPAWLVLAVFTALSVLIFADLLPGDLARPLYAAAIVLVVLIIAFTVMQYAFEADVAAESNTSELGFKALAFSATGLSVWDWNVAEEQLTIGRDIEAALGVAAGSLSGDQNAWLDQIHPIDRDRFIQVANGAVTRSDGNLEIEIRLRTSNGGQRWFRLRARAVSREGNMVTRFVGSLEDITAAKNSQDRLLKDAVQDALTGLPNRALFIDRLGRAMARAQGRGVQRPCLLVIDVDRFKNVNDGFGHAVGDSILTIIAQRMSELIEPQDTLARIQGDQFAVVLHAVTNADDAASFGDDLRQVLNEPIFVGEQEVFLTGSIGVAVYDPDRHDTPEDLYRDGELAMVHAKTNGFDRVEVFRDEMHGARSDRLSLESDLRRALERQEVELLYQPIVNLKEERIAGFEALMRWHHGEHGELAPDDFIAIAEEIGLIVELGHFALENAARQLATWRRTFDEASELFVSVNVSSRQIFRQDLMRDVRLVMTRADIPAGALRLEITESLVMENPELAAYVLERLSAMGAGLALDDFGTGYSALSYLQRFPFDTVKVDKSIVTGGQGNAPVIVKSIVNMAHDLGMRVIAEGIESDEDVEYLLSIGCEFGQGYHFAPPLDVASASKYLAEWR